MAFDLTEAFKSLEQLDNLNEDTVSLDAKGIEELDDIINDTTADDTIDIIDIDATAEDDLQKSYVGKVILDCDVCHCKTYEDAENIVVDEATGMVNVGTECPVCYSTDGFKVIGQVAEYCPHCEEETEVEVKEESAEVCPECGQEPCICECNEIKEDTVKTKSGKWVNKGDTGLTHGEFRTKKAADAQRKAMFAQGYKADESLEESSRLDDIDADADDKKELARKKFKKEFDDADSDRDYKKDKLARRERIARRAAKRFGESFERVEIETDEDKIIVETEPKAEEEKEIIVPVSDETKVEIETKPEEKEEKVTEVEDEVDFDEFDEEEFDDFAESYLKEVYDNVKSYKTTGSKFSGRNIKLEGVITFNSGKTRPTTFKFMESKLNEDCSTRLFGENKDLARGRKAFTLKGKVEDKKLKLESFSYNYRHPVSLKESVTVKGTITK